MRRQWRDPSKSEERTPVTAPVNKSKPKTYLNPFDIAGSVQLGNLRGMGGDEREEEQTNPDALLGAFGELTPEALSSEELPKVEPQQQRRGNWRKEKNK